MQTFGEDEEEEEAPENGEDATTPSKKTPKREMFCEFRDGVFHLIVSVTSSTY